ncbi:hypothetical protein KEM52_003873 [Ascosphaera acerosa]|nr:hypothetical protein KEM52_003873 [Ascosphaera acerosa]
MEELSHDPAFLEWFKLQDSFQYNVTTNLLACLSNILSLPPSAQLDKLILSTLDVVQGTLLLHPPSRALFAREINMNLLLDLLEPTNSPQVQIATLFTLVSACMCHPASTRCFEELDGLLTITSLFKLRATRKEVKVRLVEFLYFYLMPESPRERGGSSSSSRRGSGRGSDQGRGSSGIDETTRNCIDGTTTGNGSGSVGSGSGRGSGRSNKSSISTRCTRTLEEKKLMLGKYLNNVDDLVADLRETIPFGNG